MEAFAGPENLQCEPSGPVEGQCDSQNVASSPSVINEYKTANCHELTLSVYDPNLAANDIVNLRSDELVEVPVAVVESHHKHTLESGMQDIQSNNKGIGSSRSWEDGYNWRKYGQKRIKGNEFPRSYYKCSHPNCQVKKQVEQSHDGCIRDVIYRGKHDHPKPQTISHISACTFSSVQGERFNGLSTSKNVEDKSSNGNGRTSLHAKPNNVTELSKPYGTHEPSLVGTTDNNMGEEGVQFSRMRDEVQDDGDDPESKRRCLNLSTEMTNDSGANCGQNKESLEAHQGRPQAFLSSPSNENVNVTDASHEMTLPVTAPNPPTDMVITSNAIVPVDVDYGDSQKTQGADIGVQAIQTDHRGTCHSVTADRFWGDGYNWRKYGQKHIKGSEFPRSYYRCTHPNCQVKKQLECSHDGQITDIVYKGEHNHPKPQPNSHIAVGRILSIQEEGFEQLSPLNQTYDKSPTRQTSQLNINPDPVQTSDTDVQAEGSKSNRTDNTVEHNTALDSKCDHLKVSKKTSKDVATGLNHRQGKPFVEVQRQCQSQTLASPPSVICKDTAVSSRELTPSTVSVSPVYMVTSKGIVPVEVDTEDNRQRQSSGNGVEAEESNPNGLSLSMTERLLENAYHWRKYGQKNIKGSEFPRSYYRCTHPNCQVKMQLERSHDGRIIEIIYKGKHDHPKPQPITRMAIGAILSLEEDRSDKISEASGDQLSKEHVKTFVCNKPNRITEPSPVAQSVENIKTAGEKLNRSFNEAEDDNDMECKRRKIEMGDMDLTPVIRTPREPRVVVETLSEFDVVDDGYRWQKYGRKIVKGNSNPRNYYRCSNGGCSVKKHVERAANNPKAVITTYEGKHNHDLPLARITTHDTAGILINGSSETLGGGARSGEFAANDMDAGVVVNNRWSPEYRMHEREEIIDLEPIQSMVIEPAHNNADGNRLNKNGENHCSFNTEALLDSANPNAENS